jgi:hypothetical protein
VPLYASCLAEARAIAGRLGEPGAATVPEVTESFGELQFFNVG